MAMARSPISPAFTVSDVRVIQDTREQTPFDLQPMQVEVGTLATGDYALADWPSAICVERKSLQDLVGVVGRHRERFEKELQRMMGFRSRLIVVEASLEEILARQWVGKITPEQVVNSLLSWQAQGVPFQLWGSPGMAARMVRQMLFLAARKLYGQSRAMCLHKIKGQN